MSKSHNQTIKAIAEIWRDHAIESVSLKGHVSDTQGSGHKGWQGANDKEGDRHGPRALYRFHVVSKQGLEWEVKKSFQDVKALIKALKSKVKLSDCTVGWSNEPLNST